MDIRVLIADTDSKLYDGLDGLTIGDVSIQVVSFTTSAQKTLQDARSHNPDVILIDADCREWDAFSLAETLMGMEDIDSILIFLSSDTSPMALRQAMLAGAQDYLVKPIDLDAIANSIKNLAQRLRRKRPAARPEASAKPACQTILVASAKGGVGKSTFATNLALALRQEEENPVALIDLDGGDSALMLNLPPKRALTELISVADEVDELMLQSYALSHPLGLTVFTGQIAGDYLNHEPLPFHCLQAVLAVLKGSYRYIILDTPTMRPGHEFDIFEEADVVFLLMTNATLLDLRDAKALLDALSMTLSFKGKVYLVLNRYVRCTRGELIREGDIEKHLNTTIYAKIPEDLLAVASAINLGKPVMLSMPNSPTSQAIRQLAKKLVGGEVAEPKKAAEPKKRKFFFVTS